MQEISIGCRQTDNAMQQAPTLNIMIIFINMVRGHEEQQPKFGIVAAIRIHNSYIYELCLYNTKLWLPRIW